MNILIESLLIIYLLIECFLDMIQEIYSIEYNNREW